MLYVRPIIMAKPINFTSEFNHSAIFPANPHVEDSSYDDMESSLKHGFREVTAEDWGLLKAKEYDFSTGLTKFKLKQGEMEAKGFYSFIPDKISLENLLNIYNDLKTKLKEIPNTLENANTRKITTSIPPKVVEQVKHLSVVA